jgi:DmsE family decaheme c-type cytochrome
VKYGPRLGALAAVLAAGLAAVVRAQTPAPSPSPTPAPAPGASAEAAGPACSDCHAAEAAAFAKNPHARSPHKQTPADVNDLCSTCHGDGTKHAEAGGDPSLIQVWRGVEGAENCLSCHSKAKGTEHESFTTGFHANSAAVNCLSCHAIHKAAPGNPHLLAKAPGEVCATCHTSISASFRSKPYAHRLDRGGMTCLDCHEPHNRKGETLRLTRQGELPCLSCHAEKRGPFVFDHVTGSGGDCLSCHDRHGSNNPKQLQWAQVSQLCLSCHSRTGGPSTAGPQPPAFHDLTLPRYRNCTTCHVAVHGSNLSPTFLK